MKVNPMINLLMKSDFRQWAVSPFKSMGYRNFAASLIKAKRQSKGNKQEVPRYLIPELWKNLGSRKAVVTSTGTVSFEQLAERAVWLSNSLSRRGLSENDRVACLVNSEQAWFDLMSACMISGIKMPMLNTHLRPEEVAKCINNCAPKVLVFSAAFLESIQSIEDKLETVELFVVSASAEEAAGLPENYISLEKLIGEGEPKLLPGGFGLAQMPFSGGSTGVPKFIVDGTDQAREKERQKGISQRDLKELKAKFLYAVSKVGAGKVAGDIVSLIPGPLYHSGVQVAVFPLYFGGTVVPMIKYDAERFLQLIEQEKANFTFVAPTMLERILKLPEAVQRKYDLSSMQVLYCAAAPCADYVKVGINQLFKQQGAKGSVFHEYYGSSEAGVVTVLEPEHYEEKSERYKSVGKVVGTDCITYNVEEKRVCEPGEDGHVCVRGYRVHTVNYGNSAEMDDAFLEIDGSYWYDDGCVGHLDKDGFLYLTSRSKDMIISGGVNIFPVEIEEVLKQHENILDAAVVKVAHADLGEVPGALIQTVDGEEIPQRDIVEFCKANGLYGFKMPKHIQFIDQLPKNSAGKIRKKDLEGKFNNPVAVEVSAENQ